MIASNKTAKLFSQLDAADGLKSNVFIAEVGPKTDPVDLDVTIDVDPAMGNAFQEAAAHITFVFSVEDNELPPPPLELDKHDAYICGYPDGTVKPERQITRAEVATIFYRLLQDEARENVWSRTNSYSDVASGAWYNSAVSTLTNAGILTGYPDGTFRPDHDITRGEAMKIINKVLFRTPDKEHFLPDMIKCRTTATPTPGIHGCAGSDQQPRLRAREQHLARDVDEDHAGQRLEGARG